jgi:RNA polymerase sigma-70 factor, ECF subfamily
MVDAETIQVALLGCRIQLLGYINTIVRDQNLAEDVLQDVAVLAIRKAAEIRDLAHLQGWLRQTARYRALCLMRDRHRQPRLLGDEVLDVLDRSWAELDQSSSAGMLAVVPDCLKRLSPYARKLLKHRFEDGLTGQQLAGKLGRELNTIYVALTRIYRRLDRCIRESLLRLEGKSAAWAEGEDGT